MTTIPQPNQAKGTTANTNHHPHLTVEQARFIEATYLALLKIYSRKYLKASLFGLQPADLANYAIQKVVANISKYLHRTPVHTANAVAKSAYLDLLRRERAQRGHGARGTRTVLGDNPINPEDPDSGTIIDNHAAGIIDPETWIEADHRGNMISGVRELMSELAFHGFVLTSIHDLTQEEAAVALGVTRSHLNKEMRKATKRLKELGASRENWGMN